MQDVAVSTETGSQNIVEFVFLRIIPIGNINIIWLPEPWYVCKHYSTSPMQEERSHPQYECVHYAPNLGNTAWILLISKNVGEEDVSDSAARLPSPDLTLGSAVTTVVKL
jgi:hypothetical protein